MRDGDPNRNHTKIMIFKVQTPMLATTPASRFLHAKFLARYVSLSPATIRFFHTAIRFLYATLRFLHASYTLLTRFVLTLKSLGYD
jgi:hypothetical protein